MSHCKRKRGDELGRVAWPALHRTNRTDLPADVIPLAIKTQQAETKPEPLYILPSAAWSWTA